TIRRIGSNKFAAPRSARTRLNSVARSPDGSLVGNRPSRVSAARSRDSPFRRPALPGAGRDALCSRDIVAFPSREDLMKRLYRSTRESKLTGLCGGLGEYFDLDPVLFRLLFILLAFMSGIGILAYLILCLMVPREETAGAASVQRLRRSASDRKI